MTKRAADEDASSSEELSSDEENVPSEENLPCEENPSFKEHSLSGESSSKKCKREKTPPRFLEFRNNGAIFLFRADLLMETDELCFKGEVFDKISKLKDGDTVIVTDFDTPSLEMIHAYITEGLTVDPTRLSIGQRRLVEETAKKFDALEEVCPWTKTSAELLNDFAAYLGVPKPSPFFWKPATIFRWPHRLFIGPGGKVNIRIRWPKDLPTKKYPADDDDLYLAVGYEEAGKTSRQKPCEQGVAFGHFMGGDVIGKVGPFKWSSLPHLMRFNYSVEGTSARFYDKDDSYLYGFQERNGGRSACQSTIHPYILVSGKFHHCSHLWLDRIKAKIVPPS